MGRLRFIELAAVFLGLNSLGVCTPTGNNSGRSNDTTLPIVDLGYEIHQARSLNTTGDYYTFSNIRYAAAPVGDLRFSAPQHPKTNRSAVQTGSQDRICPQATPEWIGTAYQFVPRYLKGESEFNESSFNSSAPPAKPDPRQTEDCLFLDVSVPRGIFEKAGKSHGAPVLAWIHGGGMLPFVTLENDIKILILTVPVYQATLLVPRPIQVIQRDFYVQARTVASQV